MAGEGGGGGGDSGLVCGLRTAGGTVIWVGGRGVKNGGRSGLRVGWGGGGGGGGRGEVWGRE